MVQGKRFQGVRCNAIQAQSLADVNSGIIGELKRAVRAFYVDVHNRRPELGDLSAIARLERIVTPDGTVETDIDRSPLKVTGQPGYTQVVWPDSYATWDCLAVSMDEPPKAFLNSALDLNPRTPIISETGEYLLAYEVFAENFPVLRFEIKLSVNIDPRTTSATLVALQRKRTNDGRRD